MIGLPARTSLEKRTSSAVADRWKAKPSYRRATCSRKLFSGFLAVPAPAKGPPLPRTLRLPSHAALRWLNMSSALRLCPRSRSVHLRTGCHIFPARRQTDVCMPICRRQCRNFMHDKTGRLPGSRLNVRILALKSWGQFVETGTIQFEGCCRELSRYQPLSAAWQGEVPPRKPLSPPGGASRPGTTSFGLERSNVACASSAHIKLQSQRRCAGASGCK